MSDENEKVDRPDEAVSGEIGVTVEVVIGDVANEEECGKDGSGEHEALMDNAVAAADIDVTANQTDSAERVKESVGGGEDADPVGGGDSAFEIDEPDEKRGDGGAQG